MKCVKPITKSIFLLLLFTCFFVSLYGNNEFSNCLDSDSSKSKHKVHLKIAPLEDVESFKQDYQIDSLMQNYKFKKVSKTSNFKEETIKESSIVEDWLIIFESEQKPCSDSKSDFIEKEWMNKHNFLIL